MRKILILTLLMIGKAFWGWTAIYYVSSTGSDLENGTSTGTAWQTLTKVNSVSFVAGDQILFQRGSTFYGSLTIKNSGTTGSPITFGAYGTGANPIITGFTSVTAWTNLGSNIWESTNAVSTLSTCEMVTINGVNTPMGRYPNTGYLPFQSHTTTSLTSSSLTGTPDWSGATVCFKFYDYILSRKTITSQTSGTLNWVGAVAFSNGSEFFIQNDVRTLDSQNEWYYNPSTKKIRIYSSTQPANVKVSSLENLVEYAKDGYNYSKCSYINIENLTFIGSNGNTIQSYQSLVTGHTLHDTNIIGCSISFSGLNAIRLVSDNLSIENCTLTETNGSAINNTYSGINSIKNNNLSNISLTPGVGGEYGDIAISCTSIISANIEGNSIVNCGFNGISFNSSSATTLTNNFISSSNKKLHDGGAISMGGSHPSGTKITGNVCIGDLSINGLVAGIYLDDNSANVEVSYNTIANCSWIGLYLHNANNNNVHHNTVYNNGIQFRTADDALGGDIYGNTISNNQFISKTSTQTVAALVSNQDNLTTIGTLNNNIYARPIDDNVTFSTNQPSTGSVSRSLAGWQSFSSQDANSKKSPVSISSESDIQFMYNETNATKTVALDNPSVDMNGAKYVGSITLQPYTSAVYLKDPNPATPAPVNKRNAVKSGIYHYKSNGYRYTL